MTDVTMQYEGPRAISTILRDLQAEAEVEAEVKVEVDAAQEGEVYANLAGALVATNEKGALVIEFSNGNVIECDNPDLTDFERIHCKIALEQDGDDADGEQGGQDWSPPTVSPTSSPTAGPTSVPTSMPTPAPTKTTDEPTDAPTPRGDPFVLRGIIWYDRNANGRRDSNMDEPTLGRDVEFNIGLGGVQVQLTECDPDTNMALSETQSMDMYSDGSNSYAGTISRGYNVMMHALLVHKWEGGGKFELTNIRVARSYFIQVSAPSGYLFTGGVCNDGVEGWECPTLAGSFAGTGNNGRGRRRWTSRHLVSTTSPIVNPDAALPSVRDLEVGIREGRSLKCVSVDAAGVPEARLDLGVMRVGDLRFDDTDVNIGLDMASVRRGLQHHSTSQFEDRSLMEGVQDRVTARYGRGLESRRKKINKDGRFVYELADREVESIGEVTAEVLASRLDKALEVYGGILDSVSHVDVTFYALDSDGNEESPGGGSASAMEYNSRRDEGGRLEVNLKVRGHYTANVNVDFDYIVEESINRESSSIRTQMTSYNQQCNDQKAKIDSNGYTLDDFAEVQSNYGVKEIRTRHQQQNTVDDQEERLAWSTACEKKQELPKFVEENLEALEAKVIASQTNDGSGMSPWAIVGIVVGLGVIAFGFAFIRLRRSRAKRRLTELDDWSTDDADVKSMYWSEKKGASVSSRSNEASKYSNEQSKRVGGGGASTNSQSIEAGNKHEFRTSTIKDGHPKGIAGVAQNKMSNMTVALRSEWRRIRRGGDDSTMNSEDYTARVNSMQESQYSRNSGKHARGHKFGGSSSIYSSSRSSKEGLGSVSSRMQTSATRSGTSRSDVRSDQSSKYSTRRG